MFLRRQHPLKNTYMTQSAGNTLVETVLVIAIIGVLASSGVYLMLYLLQDAAFIPQKLSLDMLLQDAIDIIIEGDSAAKGLRFSRYVIEARPNQVTFLNQDNQRIRYSLDTQTLQLYRSINGGANSPVPYYSKKGMDIIGIHKEAFLYYDIKESITTIPLDVRRIAIGLEASSTIGPYAGWQCKAAHSSSVAVKRFQ